MKVQPIINIDNKGHACPQPLIVLCSDMAPTIKDLQAYDKSEQKPRGRKSPQMQLVIPRLHLYAQIT